MAIALMEDTWSLYLTTIAIYDAISVAEARSTDPLPPFRFCSLQHSGFAFTATGEILYIFYTQFVIIVDTLLKLEPGS